VALLDGADAGVSAAAVLVADADFETVELPADIFETLQG